MKSEDLKQIFGNLSYAFIAQAISLVLSMLMALIIPKLLDVESYAFFQLFIFYSTYVGIFHFGMTDGVYLNYGGKNYNELDKSLLASQLRIMILLQFFIALGIILFSIYKLDNTDRKFVLIATAIYILVANISWFFGFVFQAVNYTRRYSVSVIISKVTYIIFIGISIIVKPNNYHIFILLFVLAQIFALVYCLIIGKDIAFAKSVPFKKSIKAFFANAKVGSNLLFANIASLLILGSGRLVVDKAWGISTFGKFSFALSLSGFFLQFINQVSMVLFPALRRIKEDEIKKIYNLLSKAMGLILPIIYLVYTPVNIILGIWLPQYKDSLIYLAILLPICIFDSKMNLLCITYLKVLRKEKVLLWLNVATMVLSFILSFIGVYLIKSIYMVVLFMVFSIAFRSVVSELYLSKLMGTKVKASIIQELTLAIIFLISSWFLGALEGFLVVLSVYIAFLLLNLKNIRDLKVLLNVRKNLKG